MISNLLPSIIVIGQDIKQCSKCKIFKNINDFFKHKKLKYGLSVG